jgi:serine/threonine protein kinase
MADTLIGKRIGDFVIEERLGQGAMAVVYKAFEPSINRHVALKVIRLDEGQGQHEEFRRRFAREAEVIAQLEHIHVLPIYAYGINEEMAYLAMRWLRGGSLSELTRREAIGFDRAADIFQQVAQGLAYAHSKGVVHRDLKPSNIMLDDTGNAYLADFGLAKLAEGSGELTRSGTIVGTPAYMSPEQLRGEPLDHRSDIYGLGVILYNMLAGRLPFDTTTGDLVSIIYQHLERPPIPPREFNPDIPPSVEEVILRALHKDRNERFNTATQMSRALNIALGRPPGSSDHLEPISPSGFYSTATFNRTGAPTQRRKLIPFIAIAVAMLVVVIGLIGFQIVNNNQSAAEATRQALLSVPTLTGETPRGIQVLKEQSASASEIEPNQDQITIARNRLGPNGFIAYIACTLDSEYHAGLAREMSELAKQYEMTFRTYDSQDDAYKQVTQVERARVDGASALVVFPCNVELLDASLSDAQSKQVPLVFAADSMPSYGGVLVGGDNYQLGLEPGRYAGQIIRDEMNGIADVVILDWPDLEYIVERANGLEDGVKEFAPGANIVGRYRGGTREFGTKSVQQLIADGIQFSVIVSINDAGAIGAIEAMNEAGIDPQSVIVTSIDAEPLAKQYIRDGHFMRGSVQSSRIMTANALINSAVKLLAGAVIAENILVPPGMLVTKESLTAELLNLTAAP